jgi:hypothetical protein
MRYIIHGNILLAVKRSPNFYFNCDLYSLIPFVLRFILYYVLTAHIPTNNFKMGRAGRIACIFTPFALSIASLICIILVMSAGLSKGSSTLSQMYFFRTDLSGLYNNPLSPGSTTKEVALSDALKQIKTAGTVKRFYDIYMWNFCAGNSAVPNEFSVCGKAKADWSFDLITVWGLNGTGMEYAFPKELTDGFKVFDAVSKWNYYAYLFAAIATVLELMVGISAIFSRWGSFATTIFSGVSALLAVNLCGY